MITDASGKVLFTDDELGCSCCGRQRFAPGFEDRLATYRKRVGIAMPLTSACRCPQHNEAVGGHYRSLHLTDGGRGGGACAVDFACQDGAHRAAFIETALDHGFSVGVASNFLHIDDRTRVHGLEQRVFHYKR